MRHCRQGRESLRRRAQHRPRELSSKQCSPSLLRLLTARPRDQALFAAYDGPLYNVSRPDGTSKNIGVLKAGGFADIKTHDGEPPERLLTPARSAAAIPAPSDPPLPAAFCAKGDCVISNVFDQSHCGGKCPPPAGNHLGQRHKLVNASQHKISVGGGTEVYGM